MSQIKESHKTHKSHKSLNYEESIMNINKKKEHLYNNHEQPQNLTEYSDHVVVYTHLNLDKNQTNVYQDKKKPWTLTNI